MSEKLIYPTKRFTIALDDLTRKLDEEYKKKGIKKNAKKTHALNIFADLAEKMSFEDIFFKPKRPKEIKIESKIKI